MAFLESLTNLVQLSLSHPIEEAIRRFPTYPASQIRRLYALSPDVRMLVWLYRINRDPGASEPASTNYARRRSAPMEDMSPAQEYAIRLLEDLR